jgi:hypothetical protein
MSSPAVPNAAPVPARPASDPLRVAFVGSSVWLDGCCPAPTRGLVPERIAIDGADGPGGVSVLARAFRPHVTVVLDPLSPPAGQLGELPGVTLGLLVGGVPGRGAAAALSGLDRLVSFLPALTGTPVAERDIWRVIPPPVSDALFGEVRPLHGRPRAIAVGRASAHRERMLMPAKHHHDLLQVIHGVSGAPLAELLAECDVGVYVAAEPGGGFGHQVGMHLAAGHLLLAETLVPAHGLERNIDYLHVDSPEGLAWVLERLGRFPEMHQRIRVRGRMKAEQYRASRVFARVAADLLADVSAFG